MLLIIDNFDSFTYNLVDYFERLGEECIVYRNNVSTDIIFAGVYDGMILSPGPGIPKDAGFLLDIIDHYQDKLPILGICLGHQALGIYYGASLKKAIRPVHGKISTITLKENDFFKSMPSKISIVRYHSLIVYDLPNNLNSLSETSEGELMIMKHISLPIYGIQFHPESILTEYGLDILNNWLLITGIKEK